MFILVTSSIRVLVVGEGDGEGEEEGERQFLCHILAAGMYPTISVCDARCFGSMKGLSKKQLWDLFSLDKSVSFFSMHPLSHPGTRPSVLWTGKLQGWTGIPVQQLVVDG